MEKESKFEGAESKEAAFHFPEIAELKDGMTKLVEKLRRNIDEEKYDALVSDEVGGRIPTLVLREIIKARKPDIKIDTYFVASGKTYLPEYGSEDYDKLIKYLKVITEGNENILLVTQYAHSGKTLAKLARALCKAGVSNLDAAVLNSLEPEEHLRKQILSAENVFVGTRDASTYKFDEKTSWLTGVAKTRDYDPRLKLLQDVITREGREKFISQEEWMEIFGIRKEERYIDFKAKLEDPELNAKWEARNREPLSEAELKKLRETIQKARDDVKTLATEILKQVWGSK